MKKIISIIGSMVMILLLFPLTALAVTSQPNTQPNTMNAKTTWFGGPVGGVPAKIEGATVDDITSRAVELAAGDKQPVEYKTEDGKIAVRAYPDYGKSKCELVHGKTWEDGKLTQSKIIEVCNRNYELPTPYTPSFPSGVHGSVR